jgi:hypothetical protein
MFYSQDKENSNTYNSYKFTFLTFEAANETRSLHANVTDK